MDAICSFCAESKPAGSKLTECLHFLCHECLTNLVQAVTNELEICCPFVSEEAECRKSIQHKDIKAAVGDAIYNVFLQKTMANFELYCQCLEQAVDNDKNDVSICNICQKPMIKSKETKDEKIEKSEENESDEKDEKSEIVEIPETPTFTCDVCITEYDNSQKITLKECSHCVCKDCMAEIVERTVDAEVDCPYPKCNKVVSHWEFKNLLEGPKFNKFVDRSVSIAMSKLDHVIRCRALNCKGWNEIQENVNFVTCYVCNTVNCILCQRLHNPTILSCDEYLKTMDPLARHSETYLEDMLAAGKALQCPACDLLIVKVDGCDWIVCSGCRVELCWATKGLRWGPGGAGDTSGGCKCVYTVQRCTPTCANCH